MATATLSHTSATIRLTLWLRRKAITSTFLYPTQIKHGSLHLALGNTLDHIGNPGKCLFHRITTLTNKITNMSHLKGLSHNINHGNLWKIECQQPNTVLRTGLSITFDCHCAVVNCRSVGYKINDIKHKIYNHNLDLCALTETWIKEDESNTIPNCLCPSGHNTISIPHINRTGGGIVLVYRSNLDIKKTPLTPLKQWNVWISALILINTISCWLLSIGHQTPVFCNLLMN